MNFKFLLAVLFCALGVVGCNSIGSKETIVARVNNESVYQEDLDLLEKLAQSRSEKGILKKFSDELFIQKALFSRAAVENPAFLKAYENRPSFYEDFALAFVYSHFFLTEMLGFSDGELRAEYEQNRTIYGNTSSYNQVRGEVAEKLLVKSKADSLRSFSSRFKKDHPSAEKSEIENEFVASYRAKLLSDIPENLIKKHGLEIVPITPLSEEAFYERHKNEFMSEVGYEVYHVESPDSGLLAKIFDKKEMDLESFKDEARRFSTNKVTASAQGYVGKVLKNHVMPFGIGFVPSIFKEFEGKPIGTLSSVVRALPDSAFHVFYLAQSFPPELKSFDRVRENIKYQIKISSNYDLDSNYVLIKKNGQPVLYERDVLTYAYEKLKLLSKESHDRIVKDFLYNFAFAAEARNLKLERMWEYRAVRRSERLRFVADLQKRNFYKRTVFPEDSLKKVYDLMGNLVAPRLPFEEARYDLSDWLEIQDFFLRRFKNYDYAIFSRDSFENVRTEIFSGRLVQYRIGRVSNLVAQTWGNANVSLYRDDIEIPVQVKSAEQLVNMTDSLCLQLENAQSCLELWKDVRNGFYDSEDHYMEVTFKIAQLLMDIGNGIEAEKEFASYYMTWPDGPDAEVAMFSHAFVLSENLNRGTDALAILTAFRQKYPDSRFNDSVDWLVSNIKSNGKVARDLMKKIESAGP